MSDPELGKLIEGEAGRDAIHIAVIPMRAPHVLNPGQVVGKDGFGTLKDGRPIPPGHANAVGIVDPYLPKPVKEGKRFWCLLFPRTTTSLRHVWTHPAFPAEVPEALPTRVAAARAWLLDLCEGREECEDWNGRPVSSDDDWSRMGVKELIARATDALRDGKLQMSVGAETSLESRLDANAERFWNSVATVAGVPAPTAAQIKEGSYFYCSC